MTVEIYQDNVKVDLLNEVTVTDKPGWVVVKSNKPYSDDIRVFAKGAYKVVEVV